MIVYCINTNCPYHHKNSGCRENCIRWNYEQSKSCNKAKFVDLKGHPVRFLDPHNWVQKRTENSISIRCNGVKGTATWDGTGRHSKIMGLAIASMKALGMDHETIQRMLKELKGK